jgi:hypothetical protein
MKLAASYAAEERWNEAVQTMELALNALGGIASRRKLYAPEEESRQAGAAKLAIWRGRISAHQ